ncbi:MAG: hypothetical protein JRD87_15700 [Deltaproteobacteria bacterium]|nr:hypothetical protein [Deltaproteobacteria bacterium]
MAGFTLHALHLLLQPTQRVELIRTKSSNVGAAPKCNNIQLKPIKGRRLQRITARTVSWSAITFATGGEYR